MQSLPSLDKRGNYREHQDEEGSGLPLPLSSQEAHMDDRRRSVPIGFEELRLFPTRYDVVRVSLVIEVHNITGVVDAQLKVFGGPHGERIYADEWIDVDFQRIEVLWADLMAELSKLLDELVGPFDD